MPDEIVVDRLFNKTEIESSHNQADLSEPALCPPMVPPYHQSKVNWRAIIWSVFGLLAAITLAISGWLIFFAPPDQSAEANQSHFAAPLSPTPSATPSETPLVTLTTALAATANTFAFPGPTAIPTPIPGGQVIILTPEAADAGWVVSEDESIRTIYDPQNHFGDSYLYAGILDGKIYYAAIQFDLSHILRGTEVHGASLRLTGLRAVQLDEGRRGNWQLQLLAPKIDAYWRTINYQQVEDAASWTEFAPPLTQEQLREGLTNQFDFNQEQLALLERRILEGTGKISFRLNGPRTGYNNLFAWDSGYGPASAGVAPELFLNLGPSPRETPPPHYVVITSTPTPENVLTAAAEAVRLTAEATRMGTATPLPPNWVTPFVVTATPTPENEATAQTMSQEATAIALVTSLPPNVATATPTPTITPTPTYVVITSTPTPENVLTAAAEATGMGTGTPLPANWATPIVVTSTPTPENEATSQARELLATAVALTTGTATVIPGNMQTATATPAFIWIEPIISPTPTMTPSPTPQLIPTVLLGRIVFLSDREEGITETDSSQAELSPTPQAYVFDPETGQLGRLTNIWPYEVAAIRDAWSSDAVYEAYNKQLLWTSIENELGNRTPTEVFAIHYYDHLYKVEHQVTYLGAGWAWDPAWSPAENQIAFVSNDSADNEIWVINHDGSHQMQLTSSNEVYNAREIGKDTFIPEVNGHPSWSPDGQQIVFYSNRTGNNQLWIMNKDGSEQRLLMDWNPYNDWDPVWIKYLDSAPPLVREPDWRFLKPSEESQGR